ncbi:MAG: single-stranded DNA-binding protein [Erysipelotrichaceae bacterium]|nr:single-stranded DNA-binding protein [Erysipelotrichaceae bacterium]
MINRVILVGRLTKDVELRKTPAGNSVVSFTLAVSRRVSRNNTSNQPTADFISCVAWNQTADLMKNYLHKGSQIGVEGRIQTRNYDDPNVPGRKVYVTEVVADNVTFLESRAASENRPAQSQSVVDAYYPDVEDYQETSQTLDLSSVDDLPF